MAKQDLCCEVYAGGRNVARAQSRFREFQDNPHFHFIPFDVCADYDFDIGFHYIIAAASGSSPKLYSTEPVRIMQTIFTGTENLLSYGLKHDLERFVFVSSGDSYGEGSHAPIKEDYCGYIDPLQVRSCYGIAKRAAESLCISYKAQFGLDTLIVRPCHTFGPFFTETDDRAFAQFFRKAIKGEDLILKSEGQQLRSWCYVVDVATAILYAMLKGISGQAYNIADSESTLTIKEFAETIATTSGVNLVLGIPTEAEKKGYSVITNSVFDTQKIRSLGWKTEGSFKEKIRATLTKMKEIYEED